VLDVLQIGKPDQYSITNGYDSQESEEDETGKIYEKIRHGQAIEIHVEEERKDSQSRRSEGDHGANSINSLEHGGFTSFKSRSRLAPAGSQMNSPVIEESHFPLALSQLWIIPIIAQTQIQRYVKYRGKKWPNAILIRGADFSP
jgi:hypothetical protein